MSEKDLIEIGDKLIELESRVEKLESLFRDKPIQIKKQQSIREFLLSKKPKDDIQKTLLIGYFLEKFENYENFNAKDIEEGFKKSKEIIPKNNVPYKIFMNARKGYFMETDLKDGLKGYTLTNSGSAFVDNNLGSE